MRLIIAGSLLSTFLLTQSAHASFVLNGWQQTEPQSSASSDADKIAKVPRPADPDNTAAPNPAHRPVFSTVRGFGQGVPLSFAVRQIVPKAVKVTFGPGADPDALVDWHGGQPWNQALGAAVQPLRLRLVMTKMAVQVRK